MAIPNQLGMRDGVAVAVLALTGVSDGFVSFTVRVWFPILLEGCCW